MNSTTIIKAKSYNNNLEKVHYIEVPSELYDNALKEKKDCESLEWYASTFMWSKLKHYHTLVNYISARIGHMRDTTLERINVIK